MLVLAATGQITMFNTQPHQHLCRRLPDRTLSQPDLLQYSRIMSFRQLCMIAIDAVALHESDSALHLSDLSSGQTSTNVPTLFKFPSSKDEFQPDDGRC
jgi:hypothetical protein